MPRSATAQHPAASGRAGAGPDAGSPAAGRAPAERGAPIQRRKLYQEVYERLLGRIRGGEFPVGGQLPSERELMQTYGVGRPAVREALMELQRMGLIAITHGDRARMNEVSADTAIRQVGEIARYLLDTAPGTLEQLKEARLFFEVGMVCIAAETATPQDIERLRQALDAHRAAFEAGDVERFLHTDMAFHRAIAAVSRNPIFQAVSAAMLDWLERYHLHVLQAPGAERFAFREHTRVFECIARRDPEAAAKAMTEHLQRSARLYTAAAAEALAQR
jgi:DNA-binding FadR family transcriptional regulator